MKVLQIVPSFHPAFIYGGPIVSVYELCRSLAMLGCDVRVLTTDANGLDQVLDVPKGRDVMIKEGFHVRYCRRLLRHDFSVELLRQLPEYVHWADVVHLTAVYSFPTFPTLTATRLFHKPLVWSPRGSLQRWKGSTRSNVKRLWEIAAGWAAPCKTVLHVTSEQERVEGQHRFPNHHFAVIANGIEIPPERPRHNTPGKLNLLFLGRIHPIKGIENLLAACAALDRTLKYPWSLVIAGGGEPSYVGQLQVLARRLGLKGEVRFVGEVVGEEKTNLFLSADIAVFPSYRENFGMVVVEALAHGVPVIACKGMPWSDLNRIGCGSWVENDPDTLAMAIQKMSEMRLSDMGRAGREWVSASFSWLVIAKQMATMYRELCSRG